MGHALDASISAMTVAYEIGPFRLDPRAKILTHDGIPVDLGGRAVAVLAALVARPNECVPKAAIIAAAWPGLRVEEGNLSVQISSIRKVLARAPGGDAWVKTLARRGYRFVGPALRIPLEKDGGQCGARRGNLLLHLTSFIGRNAARDDLREFLRDTRLVTITGAGGIGKTRLAVQVAEDLASAYRDGAWFVDLASLVGAALVPSTIAQALGVGEAPGRTLLQSICSALASSETLIVLDNCEHVLDSAALAVETLLRACGGVTILATSREPFQIPGEQAYPLDPLALPAAEADVDGVLRSEAGSLFMDRFLRQQPQFELTDEDAKLVAALCAQLDGIPLALELAAARARSLSLGQIHERLGNRFALLTGGARTALPRQKTLRATLDWSHELLGEEERLVLRRCAVFAGGFTPEAAEFVVGAPAPGQLPLDDVISLLVTRSLLLARTRGNAVRYGMLETTRAYAIERLDASGETDAIRRSHALHFLAAMQRAAEDWLHLSDVRWHAAHAAELDNVRAALDWALGEKGDAGIAVALAGASGPLWSMLMLEGEGIARLRAALDCEDMGVSTADRDRLRARARLWLWFGVLVSGETGRAHAAIDRAVALYRGLDDPRPLALALVRQGRLLASMGHFDAAELALSEAFAALQISSTPKLMGFYWGYVAFLRRRQGDDGAGRVCYEKAIELQRAAGAELATGLMVHNFGDLAWSEGDLEASADAFRQSIALLRRRSMNGRGMGLGFALANLAGVLTEQGELDEALEVAREGLPLLLESGLAWFSMDHFALRLALAGDLAAAARLSGYADAQLAKRSAEREVNEARAFEHLQRLLARAFRADDLQALRRQGAELDDAAACRIAARGSDEKESFARDCARSPLS